MFVFVSLASIAATATQQKCEVCLTSLKHALNMRYFVFGFFIDRLYRKLQPYLLAFISAMGTTLVKMLHNKGCLYVPI